MAANLKQPIRMCIVCRTRYTQASLTRLQCRNGELSSHDGEGRSFYLCSACLEHKKTPFQLARYCKGSTAETLMNRLKEIAVQ